MWFVIIGVALLVLHFAGIGPPAQWNFEIFGDLWKFALPFVAAVLWWSFADSIGLTQRREMRKMDERKADRREKALEALGIDARRDRKARAAREAAKRQAAEAPPPPAAAAVKDPTMVDDAEPRKEPRL
jgi:small Trp-rich protein